MALYAASQTSSNLDFCSWNNTFPSLKLMVLMSRMTMNYTLTSTGLVIDRDRWLRSRHVVSHTGPNSVGSRSHDRRVRTWPSHEPWPRVSRGQTPQPLREPWPRACRGQHPRPSREPWPRASRGQTPRPPREPWPRARHGQPPQLPREPGPWARRGQHRPWDLRKRARAGGGTGRPSTSDGSGDQVGQGHQAWASSG
jgi:hypothetical protein